MNEGKTHWEGCWRHHHECAVKRLEEMEAQDPSISPAAAVFRLLSQRDDAQIRLLGALWKLVEDEVISESKARELADVNIEEWRRMLRHLFTRIY